MSQQESKAGRSRLFGVLRLVVAIALLWFVASTVPWDDTISFGGRTYVGAVGGDLEGGRGSLPVRADRRTCPRTGAIYRSVLRCGHGGEVRATRDGIESETFAAPTAPGAEPAGSEPSAMLAGQCSWQPGMPRAFSDLDFGGLVPALGLMVLSSIICTTRWWRLLARIDCPTSWFNALRLTYIGLFFNLVVPGLTAAT